MPEKRDHCPASDARELSNLQTHDARWRSDLLIDIRSEVSDPTAESQWFSALCRPTLLRRIAAEISSRLPNDTTFLRVDDQAVSLMIGVAVALHSGLRLVSDTTADAPRGSGERAAVIGLIATSATDSGESGQFDGIYVVGAEHALFSPVEIVGRADTRREEDV
ncbi:hypothetical protein [Pseudoclavibacter sp. CFCC 11306]|uniref:hypothetical protein n=1 Tax=Pseudoclavibacter sp. CFCC 11306 TaxID=1564493 RepID=UPI001300E8A7|nr:hypothetical protein [Pseudoclavibacter sp. CFCC 11306]KAB1657675.1 hypothetical protein F8O09_08645 [Pseudoclavibacter sp. CFCC 11306]